MAKKKSRSKKASEKNPAKRAKKKSSKKKPSKKKASKSAPRTSKKGVDKTNAVIGLIVNLFIPGLGTLLLLDEKKSGIWQLVLAIISVPLTIILIGPLIYLIAWIWALISGINAVKSA